ncbi:transcription antitermination factor NusB [Streptococcus anginosus]|uniref:transcription antitermination factor NusB n=1 Tax=Streptococcus anginosus TaxID=1328 RepID=UPI00195E0433|nr:transcription antitermination factor NusB [Streptococcus anginosus]VTY16988.1 N utilization substance protein B [Streptococcus anginosus]
MTDVQLEARRELRERAFQALMSLEYEKDIVEACRFAYLYDKDMTNDSDVEIPAFLLNLVTGVEQSKNELDDKLSQYLKEGWTLERLTLIEKNILRLGLFEMTEFDTPQLVVINEAIELSKKFSDEKSSKFINGILSKFVIE